MNLQHASVGSNILSGMNALATSDATRYSLPNWVWTARGNPGWQEKLTGFATFVAANADHYDVFQMKFCFIDQAADFAAYRDQLLSLESGYPTKRFIWWTMPIKTSGSDNALRAQFNQQVRAYCAANGKPLFDIAAIESHDAAGNPVTADGSEAMDPAWSSDGGHLGDAGADRAAKAMWWLMARLGGWNGP